MTQATHHRPAGVRGVIRAWSILLVVAAQGLAGAMWAQYAWIARERINNPATYLAEADRLMKLRDMGGALRQVDEALLRSPDDPAIYTFAGHIYFEFKHWDQAQLAYEKAMDRGSTDPGTRANLLWTLIEMEAYDRAISLGIPWARQNGADSPDSAHLGIYNRYVAEAYIRSQRRPEAIPFLEAALHRTGNDIYLMTQLAQAYERAGRTADAEAMRSRIDEIQANLPRLVNDQGVFQPQGSPS